MKRTFATVLSLFVWILGSAEARAQECPTGVIATSSPPHLTIDARQPSTLEGIPQGIGDISDPITITIALDDPDAPPPLNPSCWGICETNETADGPNAVSFVNEVGQGTYEIVLGRPITPGASTTIFYSPDFGESSFVTFTSHPANTNADEYAAAPDVIFLIDMLNGVAIAPHGIYSQDIDRSGRFNAADALRVIDLLMGVDAFDEWLFTSLPAQFFCTGAPHECPAVGDCCTAHDTPGCDDMECCHAVAAQEHMCAMTAWFQECADIALAICNTCGGTAGFCGNGYIDSVDEECDPPNDVSCDDNCKLIPPDCTLGAESCCEAHDSPSCSDTSCCSLVCDTDPRCCWYGWDAVCAEEAATLCGGCEVEPCGTGPDSCCEEHESIGCNDADCCETVCELDSYCCTVAWDSVCASIAGAECLECGAPVCPADGSCFAAHDNGGCNQTFCCEFVCNIQESCCTETWDATCAALALENCNPTPFVGFIDVEVNNTKDQIDDYLTWSPTIVRIRVREREADGDLTVVLANATANGTGGRGKVVFENYAKPPDQWPMDWPADATATKDNITVTLPRTGGTDCPGPAELPCGEWKSFVVAGKFGFPSTGLTGIKGRDAIIEVHESTADGEVLKTHDVMVRVRRNVENMTDAERTRYADTLKAIHDVGTQMRPNSQYQALQDMHHDGAQFHDGTVEQGDVFIHNDSAFLPWHRAMILHLERKLQAQNPAVTVPYWDSDNKLKDPPVLFVDTFMGTVDPTTGKVNGVFSEANGWLVLVGEKFPGLPAQVDTPITRTVHDFTGNPTQPAGGLNNSGPVQISESDDAVNETDYASMADTLELNIHNFAHAWVGGVNNNMRRTVIDPMFFLYHCNHDRIWAKWQAFKKPDGSFPNRGFDTLAKYNPQIAFDDPANPGNFAIHAHLEQTLWPWNNATTGDYPRTAPAGAAGFPDPHNPAMLGPGKTPKSMDVIDYEGRTNPTKGLGYCYDDLPFSP